MTVELSLNEFKISRFQGEKKKAVQMEETANAKAQRDRDTYMVYDFTYQKLRL